MKEGTKEIVRILLGVTLGFLGYFAIAAGPIWMSISYWLAFFILLDVRETLRRNPRG